MSKYIPKLRFRGFSEEWKITKLKEIAQFNPKSVLPEKFEYIDLESVVGTQLISHRTVYKENAPSRAQRLAKKGDVFFQTVRPYQKNNYLYDLPFNNYVFSTGYAQLRPYIDSYFLLSRIQENSFVLNVMARSTGTSYPAINSNDLADINIQIPKSNEEQQKIGVLFKQLDDTISLQQQLVDQYQRYKRAMIQKMFPQKGERVPKFRFKGFSGEWEEHKLNYYLEVSNEKNHNNDFSAEDVLSVSGEYGIVNQIAFQGRSFAGESVSNYGIVKKGYVVYTKSPLKSNPYGIIKTNKGKDGIVSTLYAVYKPKKTLYSPIIEIMFDNISFTNNYLRPLVNKGAKNDMKVRNEDVLKGKIKLPKVEEQINICKFFEEIDYTIALYQEKLENYKQLKKALLQRMFV